MAIVRVTKLKNGIEKGERLNIIFPDKKDDGFVGREIERILRQRGYIVNSKTAGPDLEEMGVEIKTSRKDTDSRITIGTMRSSSIINNTWENTFIYEKTLCQLRIVWQRVDVNLIEIVESKIYNFSHEEIQKKLREDFAYISKKMIFLPDKTTTGPHGYLSAEKINGTADSYKLRIENSAMKKMMEYVDYLTSKTSLFVYNN